MISILSSLDADAQVPPFFIVYLSIKIMMRSTILSNSMNQESFTSLFGLNHSTFGAKKALPGVVLSDLRMRIIYREQYRRLKAKKMERL